MRRVTTILLLLWSLLATLMAQKQKEGESPVLGTIFRRVADGQGAVTLNSYGLGDTFIIDGVNHLHRFVHYLSINYGPVAAVNRPDWVVVRPLTIEGNRGTSTVQFANALEIQFDHTVLDNGKRLVDWTTDVVFKNLTAEEMFICYYPYVDYDLFGSFGDDIGVYHAIDQELGLSVIRVQKVETEGVFLFADASGGSLDFRMEEFPRVRDLLEGSPGCTLLGGIESPSGPNDFTAALLYVLALPPDTPTPVRLWLGRYQ